MNPDRENTIPVSEAEVWTAKWRESCPENCKAFLIPAVDLIEVLNEMGILGDKAAAKAQKRASKRKLDVRAYMAIETFENGATEEKILLVGTQQDSEGVYRDILNGSIDGKGETEVKGLKGPEGNSGVYDFTSPCPPYCDDESPLNGNG